jgi:hypothetical protein
VAPGLSLSCLLGASACLSPATKWDALEEVAEPTESEEATGEAAQPAYESTFQFVVLVQDDGTGEAGGWQIAKATLKFSDWRHPLSHSRDRWIGEEYCAALRAGMEKMFRGPYEIGATVSRL